jgi:predicted GIY-YIG superfamily endonuclease
MKGCFVYFFYSLDKKLLYVGMTCRLTRRMQDHFDKQLIEIENWRKDIDRNNIVLYKCNNKVDLVIYETYFINKYKPIKNQEKVYNQIPTFDLPYLEPIYYEYGERDRRTHTFKYYCKKYINEPENRNLLPEEFKIIKEIYEKLGATKMQALLCNQRKLMEALFNFNNQHLVDSAIRTKFIPGFYSRKETKLLLQNICKELGVIRGVSAKEIEPIFNIRLSSTVIDGKNYYGYYILEDGLEKRIYKPRGKRWYIND